MILKNLYLLIIYPSWVFVLGCRLWPLSSEGNLSGLGWIDGEVEIIDQKNSLILPL